MLLFTSNVINLIIDTVYRKKKSSLQFGSKGKSFSLRIKMPSKILKVKKFREDLKRNRVLRIINLYALECFLGDPPYSTRILFSYPGQLQLCFHFYIQFQKRLLFSAKSHHCVKRKDLFYQFSIVTSFCFIAVVFPLRCVLFLSFLSFLFLRCPSFLILRSSDGVLQFYFMQDWLLLRGLESDHLSLLVLLEIRRKTRLFG